MKKKYTIIDIKIGIDLLVMNIKISKIKYGCMTSCINDANVQHFQLKKYNKIDDCDNQQNNKKKKNNDASKIKSKKTFKNGNLDAAKIINNFNHNQ